MMDNIDAVALIHSIAKIRLAKCANASEAKNIVDCKVAELPDLFKSDLASLLRTGDLETSSVAEIVSASALLHLILTKEPKLGLLELALFDNAIVSDRLFKFYFEKLPEALKLDLSDCCSGGKLSNKFISKLSEAIKND